MRILACSLIVMFSVSLDATAQSTHADSRGAIAGVVGGGRTWDDEGSLGTGPVVGGRAQWRVFGTTSVEASVDALSHDRSGGFFESEGRTIFLGATLLHRFIREESARGQFYILGGLHLAKHSGSTTFDGVRRDRDSTDPGYHFGGGIAIRIGKRLELGPEARFYLIQPGNDSDPAMAYWVGGRLGVGIR
jgi:hypothetical protein